MTPPCHPVAKHFHIRIVRTIKVQKVKATCLEMPLLSGRSGSRPRPQVVFPVQTNSFRLRETKQGEDRKGEIKADKKKKKTEKGNQRPVS